jgi:nondiscriminating aspartyl-tRNA synthetase
MLNLGENVVLNGVIYNLRLTKWGGFVQLRVDGRLIQLVVNDDTTEIIPESKAQTSLSIKNVQRETAVLVEGTVVASSIKDVTVYYRDREVNVTKIQILSYPETENLVDLLSLAKGSEELLPFKFDNRHVTIRNIRDVSLFKVNSMVSNLFASYCISHGLTQIFSPKIVSASAEGGADLFSVDYFGKPVYLAQSPQFYKQMAVAPFGKVFEIAPAYRAEKSNTNRHVTEFICLDVEMGFIKSFRDVIDFELDLLRYVLKNIAETCEYEMGVLGAILPKLPEEVPSFTISEIHNIVFENYGKDHRCEQDLAPEEERLVCEYCLDRFNSDFVLATHFPADHRAFYTMDDPEHEGLSLSFDLLCRGKEITSGGQRIHKKSEYVKKMLRRGMNPENFKYYLESFEQGMPPHGGFGMGLERLTGAILDLKNSKEASLFPRDVNRVVP